MKFALLVIFVLIPLGIQAVEETIPLNPFGEVHIYPPAKSPPEDFLILVSGDGGWIRAVVKMAEILSSEDSLVAGIDINQYLKNLEKSSDDCSSPSTDFQTLAKYVQDRYGIKHNYLIGYSSGATLVYATIVQAPRSAFRAAFSFGFCPDFSVKKPLCKGQGLEWDQESKKSIISFRPSRDLQRPWIVFQGFDDQVCDEAATRAFVEEVPNGKFILLPRVGHGFNALKNWLPQFQEVFRSIDKQ